MEKRISYSDFQSVKRVAQACNPLYTEREKLRKKINELAAQYKDKEAQISALEAGIVNTFGFRVEDLVHKVIESGIDVHGNPKKTTKYLPTSIVSYDEVKKQYVISTEEPKEVKEESTIEETTNHVDTEDTAEVIDNNESVEGNNATEDSEETVF